MTIIGPDQYESNPLETITVTIRAVNIPFNAVFGDHSSGVTWEVVKQAMAADPEEIRRFTLGTQDDNFEIGYHFGPAAPAGALYQRTISGGGTTDGPFDVKPLPGISTLTLRYSFEVARAAVAAPSGASDALLSALPPRRRRKPLKKGTP